MQVNFNTQKYNQNYFNLKNNSNQQSPSFMGNIAKEVADASDALAEAAMSRSRFMEPLTKAYDNVTDWIAKNVFGKLMATKTVAKFAEKNKESNFVINHIVTAGAAVGTGMYIYKTLKLPEDKMDSDRKKVLALNHFLTFAVSTAGAYLVDGLLNKKWNAVTQKYAELYLNKPDIAKIIEKENARLVKEGKNKIDLIDYVADYCNDPKLVRRIKGMGVGKTLLIATMIYRYLVPVAVTPIANKLGDKFLAHKKEQEAKLQKA